MRGGLRTHTTSTLIETNVENEVEMFLTEKKVKLSFKEPSLLSTKTEKMFTHTGRMT